MPEKYSQNPEDENYTRNIRAHLYFVLESYGPVLGYNEKTRRIIVARELDPTDPLQREVGEKWIRGIES